MHDPNFSRYYNEVGRTEIIDAETEKVLFARYKEKNDIGARDKLIENCLRFVVKLASRYTDDIDTLKDFISAGNVGLLLAIDRFDPERNTRFLSFATYWILLGIRNELHNAGLVSMPLWYQKLVRKINRLRAQVVAKTGEEPTDKQLCTHLQIRKAQLQNLRVDRFRYIPIDLTNLSVNGTENKVAHILSRETLEDLLPHLPAKECFVLRAYYGFLHDPWSLRQIANFLGVSSERVRQIKVDALGQLKNTMHKMNIRSTTEMIQ